MTESLSATNVLMMCLSSTVFFRLLCIIKKNKIKLRQVVINNVHVYACTCGIYKKMKVNEGILNLTLRGERLIPRNREVNTGPFSRVRTVRYGNLPPNVYSIQVHAIFLPFFLTKPDSDKINESISEKRPMTSWKSTKSKMLARAFCH